MDGNTTVGERLREARLRALLTQRQLAVKAAVSVSLVRKLEQGERDAPRLETLHKLAVALGVPVTRISAGPDARPARDDDVAAWERVRQAVNGVHDSTPDGEPTREGLRAALDGVVRLTLASRFAEVRGLLPPLLRDADALVAVSDRAGQAGALGLRSTARQLAGYMMGQTWMLVPAGEAVSLALGDAEGNWPAEVAAADWLAWTLLRQGDLSGCLDLASRWASRSEPRMSSASPGELAAWGRFQVLIAAAAARDNRPGDARDALRLASGAAALAGRDFIPRSNPWQVFGPRTVAMVRAEVAMVQGRAGDVLEISRRVSAEGFPVPRNLLRHHLDEARAHAVTRDDDAAVGVLASVMDAAPEWLAQQRGAADTLGLVLRRRRKLSPQAVRLAGVLRL